MRTSFSSECTKEYHKIKNRLFVVNLLFSLLILVALILSGFFSSLKSALSGFSF